jgi:hypothetical protein
VSKSTRTVAAEIMKLPAQYCDNIEFQLTNLGLRLTFGEKSLMEGEPPTHRVAVFLPAAVVEPLSTTLNQVLADHNKLQAEALHKPAH